MSQSTQRISETSAYGKRDILKYVNAKDADSSHDLEVGGLLLQSFTLTNREKIPNVSTNDDRIIELINVHQRRLSGTVRVLEFGKRVVGTSSLMRPYSPENISKFPEACHLRCVAIDVAFQGLGLGDLIMEDAKKIAQNWGIKWITLEIFKGASGLDRFYTRHGFKRNPQGDFNKGGFALNSYLLNL